MAVLPRPLRRAAREAPGGAAERGGEHLCDAERREAWGWGRTRASPRPLCVDLHGLHVAEATAKFDELVVPVLPALHRARCVVVTGRGRHSTGGEAALREALVRHARHRALRCAVMQGNGGALEISIPVLE